MSGYAANKDLSVFLSGTALAAGFFRPLPAASAEPLTTGGWRRTAHRTGLARMKTLKKVRV